MWINTHKTNSHRDLGNIELDCQILSTENQAQTPLVFTASPGCDGYEKLRWFSAMGAQRLSTGASRIGLRLGHDA
jgi:hypothetical protein